MPSALCVTAAAGIVLAIVWWALLRYYRRLSRAKWNVINRLETRLPASPFTDEWAELHPEEESDGTKRAGEHEGEASGSESNTGRRQWSSS
jgi:hypothetical protein